LQTFESAADISDYLGDVPDGAGDKAKKLDVSTGSPSMRLFHVRAYIIALSSKYKSLYGNVTNLLHMPEILNNSE